jgi:hypothetical protein
MFSEGCQSHNETFWVSFNLAPGRDGSLFRSSYGLTTPAGFARLFEKDPSKETLVLPIESIR